MTDKNELMANALLGKSPQNGGLNATNYPNQWGLRAYEKQDGSYGGQMMPKYNGWQGQLNNLAHPSSVSTEISVGDDIGEFPAIAPNTTNEQLARLLVLKDGERMPDDILQTAQDFANKRRIQGLSPFKDVWDDK